MKQWTSPEHVGKVCVGILDVLSGEFYKENKKKEDEKDFDKLIKLSSACGYQAQIYSGLQKSHEFARRLSSLEKDIQKSIPEDFAYSQNPVIAAEEEQKSQKTWR